jgi:hypothetical protein
VTPPGSAGGVHGIIYAEVDDAAAARLKRKIFVPGVSVYLKNRVTGKQSEPVLTNVRSWFITPVLAPGQYSICSVAFTSLSRRGVICPTVNFGARSVPDLKPSFLKEK